MDLLAICTALGALGIFATFGYILWNVYNGFRVHFIGQFVDLRQKYGDWAIVTGCTDGIGKAYATELARRGINLILISRNLEKLKNTAADIEKVYDIKTKIIATDLSEGKPSIDKIQKEINSLTVGILVNNVGVNLTRPMFFDEIPEEEIWSVINVNIAVTTMLTKMILPQMKDRGKGAIVNVSSSSEEQPWPLFSVYAASKIYIKYLSDAIRIEYQKYGITVQHLAPGFVGTKMNNFSSRVRNKSFCVPDADQYAKSAVATLGILDYSTGFWLHGLQMFVSQMAPINIRSHISYFMNQVFRNDYFAQQEQKVESKLK